MADTTTTKAPFSFPQFNVAFPYSSLPAQLAASFVPPNQQFSNGSQYGRWNGVNNNAFGLFPNQFGPLFGYQPGPNMAFQPPYGNNGYLGSNQGPGSNPGMQPSTPSGPPTPTGDPSFTPPQPMPGAVAGPGGTYPMPTSPQFIDPNKVPMGGVTPTAPPGPPLTGTTSVPPAGFNPNPGASAAPTPSAPAAPGTAIAKTPLDSQNKMAAATPQAGLLSSPAIPTVPGSSQQFANQSMQGIVNDPTLMHFLASGRGGAFAQALGLGSMPQSFTPGQFNQTAQTNPAAAFQMASQGGQAYRDAIMAQNGWTQDQMNQFLNNAGYNQGGLTYRGG